MWRSQIPASKAAQKKVVEEVDDWETDPDFVNEVSEKEQRYGSKTVAGSGIIGSQNLTDLRQAVLQSDADKKKKQYDDNVRPVGYGGTYGVQTDRMDKSAVGNEYKGETEKHSSQKDYSKGFGGKYGVQTDRQDKSAETFAYRGTTEKHSSQQDYSQGFGGKYGVQTDRQDKSAETFAYRGTTEKHSSQQDYSRGFGGKYGVEHDRKDAVAQGFDYKGDTDKHSSQKEYKEGYGGTFGVQQDRKDKSAVGWEHREEIEKHSSQKDYSRGFGGKYGVEHDRQDKSAAGWGKPSEEPEKRSQPVVVDAGNGEEARSESARSIKARFENMGKTEEPLPVRQVPRTQPGRLNATRWQQPTSEPEPESKPAPVNGKQAEKRHSNGYHDNENGNAPGIYQNIQTIQAEQLQEDCYPEQEQAQEDRYLEQEQPPEVPQQNFPEQQQQQLFSEPVGEEDDVIQQTQQDQVENLGSQFAEQMAVASSDNNQEAYAYEQQADDNNYNSNNDGGSVTATAQFDYEPTAGDELQLVTGALVTDIQMVDEGWWYGTSNGATGLFPANYVELNQ